MSYESDQLRSALQVHLNSQDNHFNMLWHRIQVLETYMAEAQAFRARAEPFIKAMELLAPKPKEDLDEHS